MGTRIERPGGLAEVSAWTQFYLERSTEEGVGCQSDDGDVQNDDEPEREQERKLLCFVAEVPLRQHRTRPAANECQNVECLF